MNIILLILILFFCVVFPLWRWYQPEIEIIILIDHYRVYLWYNKWNGANYEGRVYKYLFEI